MILRQIYLLLILVLPSEMVRIIMAFGFYEIWIIVI